MVGIIGFGRFGKLMTRYLAEDCRVLVYDTALDPAEVESRGGDAASLDEVCRQSTVILAVPISALQDVLEKVRSKLVPGTLVVDVCSVKKLPVQWMESILPESVRILATHPMFGPDSAAESLQGGKIVLCPQRLAAEDYRRIKTYLEAKGLIVIEATADEHDREIAVSLALTHFIGRALSEFGARPQRIDTEGFRRLLHILEVVENDTWQLFEDMNRFNPYAMGSRNQFLGALQHIQDKLSGAE